VRLALNYRIPLMPRPLRLHAIHACLAVLCVASAAAAGQVAPVGSLTLRAAMDRAFAGNPTIAAARLRGAIDLANLAVAQERLNPEASVELTNELPHQAFGVAVPIELGGKRAKRIAVGEATIRAGQAELAATVAEIRNDVRRAYYAVLVADARVTVLREQRDLAMRARDAAQARFDAGSSPRLEVMQAGLELSAAQNEATAAESTSVASRAQLNALLGQPLNDTSPLTGAIDEGTPLTSDAAITMAQQASTQLAVLDRQIDAQRAKIMLAEALRTPDVAPTATLTHDAGPEFTYGWRAGIALTLPLFTSHRAGVTVEQATLEQLVTQRQATVLKITSDVMAAAVLAEAQRQLYARYRDQILPQAQQVEQTAQDAYQLGQTGIAALLQALQATRDIRLRALDAASQYQAALADLERAIGAPLP
jgi:outer membrane protein, heavy metal efflux system